MYKSSNTTKSAKGKAASLKKKPPEPELNTTDEISPILDFFDDPFEKLFETETNSLQKLLPSTSKRRKNTPGEPSIPQEIPNTKRLKPTVIEPIDSHLSKKRNGVKENPSKINKTVNCNVIVSPAKIEAKTEVLKEITAAKENSKLIINSTPTLPPPMMSSMFDILPPVIQPSKPMSFSNWLASKPREPIKEERSRSRSKSPTSASNSSRSPSPEKKTNAMYLCPECEESEEFNEADLVTHITSHDSTKEDLVCPLCERKSADFEGSRTKDLKIHIQVHAAQNQLIPPAIQKVKAELITKGSKPNLLGLGRGIRLHGNRLEMGDLLWDFVVNLDINDEPRALVMCDLCYNEITMNDTHAIVTCEHDFHSDCLEMSSCPVCKKTEEPTSEQNEETKQNEEQDDSKKQKTSKKRGKKKKSKSDLVTL